MIELFAPPVVPPTASALAPCPVCSSGNADVFFTVDNVPLDVGFLWPTRAEALAAPAGDLALAGCAACGFVWNTAFQSGAVSYAPGYEVSLHHSPRYRAFLEATATRLTQRYDLDAKTIVEIGCGQGRFLELLCAEGRNQGLGIDPCVAREGRVGSVTYIRDQYGPAYADSGADLICCRHVLQHIPAPVPFLQAVRRAIGDRQDVAVYFELPNAAYVFDTGTVWTVFYEHCNYFTPRSLTHLFRQCGFEVTEVAPCYAHGQYLCLEARPAWFFNGVVPTPADLEPLHTFGQTYTDQVEDWTRRLARMQDTGQRVVTWGSGGRGITFLNALPAADLIQQVVDINPDRQGMFIPVTGQQVIAPEALQQDPPDVIVITNPTYAEEIKNQVRTMGLAPTFYIL